MTSVTTINTKNKKGKTYIPGAFSTSVVTENIENENTKNYYEHETQINRNHNDKKVLISFIDDSSVPIVINWY